MSNADDIAALRSEIESLRRNVDVLNEAATLLHQAVRRVMDEQERQRRPSFVDALLSPAGIRTREMTATEVAMHERVRRRAKLNLYRREDDR